MSFDIANFNLLNWANATPDLYDSEPKNVNILQKDENGNIVTKTIANRGMFKKQLWDDVGSALGQFNRKFYVDPENGDDNNDGSSENPFKTIKKAIEATPIGGKVTITFPNGTSDDIKQINITEEHYCVIEGKIVYFRILPYTNLIFNSRSKDTHDSKGYFTCNNSFIFITGYGDGRQITLKAKDENVDWSYLGRWSLFELSNSLVKINFYKNNQIYFEDNSPNFVSVTNRDYSGVFASLGFYSTKLKFDMSGDNPAYIFEIGQGNLSYSRYWGSVQDQDGNDISETDRMSGVIKDSDGKPRNIIANIII